MKDSRTMQLTTEGNENITLSMRNAAEDNLLTMNICHTIIARPKINITFSKITS